MRVDLSQSGQTDEEVALRVQRGATDDFGILLARYEKKLLRYGEKFLSRQEDIEDIVQDVFISSYQNIQSFDTSQRFSPWIYRIAHNAFVNALRKRSYNPLQFIDLDTLVSHPVYENPILREREEEEMKKMIDTGLERISPKYREVLILYYLEDISYKEIADILQIPVSTVGIRIKRGKEALRAAYRDMNIQYGEE